MKKLILFTLLILSLFLLCACTNDNGSTVSNTNNGNKQENVENNTTLSFKVQESYDFYNGYAFVDFSYDTFYKGVINKEGKVIFAFPSTSYQNCTLLENGFAHCLDNESTCHIINENGDVINKFKIDDSATFLGGGSGFICTKTIVKDFSSNYILYEIYDKNGKVIESLKDTNEIYTFRYMGDGMFGFIDQGYYVYCSFERLQKAESSFMLLILLLIASIIAFIIGCCISVKLKQEENNQLPPLF